MKPSTGRIVHYRLGADDAEKINRRRTTGSSIAERIATAVWPVGAQAHIGSPANAGDVLPMVVTVVFFDGAYRLNGQVFLDGNDTYWVNGALEGSGDGCWSWPVRE